MTSPCSETLVWRANPLCTGQIGRMPWALLLAWMLLSAATPAAAGEYVLTGEPSGSGSYTVTPVDSPPETTTLQSPEVSLYGMARCSVSYSYSETYNFVWQPDAGSTIEEDPPVPLEYELSSDLTVDLIRGTGAAWYAGSGSGWIQVSSSAGSQKINASGSVPRPQAEIVTDGAGTLDAHVYFVLDGATPSSTIQYSGELTLDANGAVIGHFNVARDRTPRRRGDRKHSETIMIGEPEDDARVGLTASVRVSYAWSAHHAPVGTMYRVVLTIHRNPAHDIRFTRESASWSITGVPKSGYGELMWENDANRLSGWHTVIVELQRWTGSRWVPAASDSAPVFVRNY